MSFNHSEKNQENYDRDAATHNELGLNSTLYLAYRDIPKLLNKYLFDKVKKNNYRILDLGCGAGLSTELILKMISNAGHQAEICGLDISEQNIKFASQRLKQAQFFKINPGESLSYLGKFDLVVCNFVLVETKQNMMINILKNIQSLLDDSGISVITNCASKAYLKSNKWYTFNNDFEENTPHEFRNKKPKFQEDQPIKIQVFASYESNVSFTFFDFYHSGAAYRKTYQAASLDLLETYKPVGKASDGIAWKSEKEHSPYKIHILSKQNPLSLEMEHITDDSETMNDYLTLI